MPVKKKPIPLETDKLFDDAEKFIALDQQIKKLSKEADVIKAKLKQATADNGYKAPSGSYTLDLVKGDILIRTTNTCRIATVLTTNALEVLKANKLTDYTETITVVRQDKLEEAIEIGKVKPEVAEKLYDIKESFAFGAKFLPKED